MMPKLFSPPLRLAVIAGAVALCLAGGVAIALAGHGSGHPAGTGPAAGAATPGTPALLGDASDAQPTPAPSASDSPSPSPAGTGAPTASAPSASPKVSALATARASTKPNPTLPGASTVPATVPGQAPAATSAPAASPSATGCPTNQQLNDAEINWLLGQVSATAGTDPQYAAGKATIDAGLQPLLGQNLCANQAQPTVNTLCADPSASSLIAAMTKKMPIYVRAYVGNPCSAQLSTVLPKLAPFTAALG